MLLCLAKERATHPVSKMEGSTSSATSAATPESPSNSNSNIHAPEAGSAVEEVTFDTQPTESRMPNSSYSAKDTLFTWADITGEECWGRMELNSWRNVMDPLFQLLNVVVVFFHYVYIYGM